MEQLKKIFNHFDKNGDGRISSTELLDVFRALGSNLTQAEVEHMMAEMDTDGDGFVTFKEFADFHASSNDGKQRELRDAFDVYDKDGNGLISAAELHSVLKSLGDKSTVEDCTRMIKAVDSDGDGFVNFEDFKKLMNKGGN